MVEEAVGGAAGEDGLDGEESTNVADGDDLLIKCSGQVDEERLQERFRIVPNCREKSVKVAQCEHGATYERRREPLAK